jgi:hypothetical protein
MEVPLVVWLLIGREGDGGVTVYKRAECISWCCLPVIIWQWAQHAAPLLSAATSDPATAARELLSRAAVPVHWG